MKNVQNFCRRATETYKSDYVPPTAHLGNKWLDIEARRNCRCDLYLYFYLSFLIRWLTRVNACIDKMVEVCPDKLKVKNIAKGTTQLRN